MDNPDILRIIKDFIGDKDYIGVAPLSLLWKEAWGDRPRKSRAIGQETTPTRLLLAFETSIPKTGKLTVNAVRTGNLEILRICRENTCPWDAWTFSAAAKAGNMEIIRYLKDNGCPWNEWACSQAARWGNMDILKFLIDNGCPWDEWMCFDAARGGHVDILKYLETQDIEFDEHTMAGAARGGCIETIEFLMDEGCPRDKGAIHCAARGGNLKILKMFIIDWNEYEETLAQIEEEQDAEKIEDFIFEHGDGTPWDQHTMEAAAEGGHIDILKFLKAEGAVWNIETLMKAIPGGHLDAVKFLVGDGCPREKDGYEGAHTDAWNDGQMHIVEWLEENFEEYKGISDSYREEDALWDATL